MNPRRVTTALFVALAVSGGFTFLISRKIASYAVSQRPPDRKYAAPSRPLQSGEVLKVDNVELVTWPGTNPLPSAFPQTADVLGREVLYPLDKDQPILARDLSVAGSGTGLAAKIPDGMRAIALRSDEIVGVAGFLFPGSHVDVLVTYRTEKSPEPITATVLQNALVIASGHQVEPDPEGKPASVTVVTLLLTPEEAERAVMATTQGAVHFVLRNGADKTRMHEVPMMLSQLSGEAPAPALKPRHTNSATPPVHAAPQRVEVETILGDQQSSATGNGGAK